MGLFSFTFVFFPQTECIDGYAVNGAGETSTGLIKNNNLIQSLLIVVGFDEIQKKKSFQWSDFYTLTRLLKVC